MPKSQDKAVNEYIIKELGRKAFWPWLADSLTNWSIIAIGMLLAGYWNNPLGYLLAILVIGNRQHALAIQGHDGTHYTIHKNRILNDYLSDILAFWPLGITTSGYRTLHFKHHQNLNTENDPEIQHRKSKAPQWDLPVTPQKVLRHALMDLVGYSIPDYFFIAKYSKSNSKIILFQMLALNITVSCAFIAAGLYWVPLLWYWSLMTSFMMFFRLRTWLEHQGSDDTHRLELNWLERIILSPHQAWYHYEHHSYPTVPYHRLHLVRQKLWPEEPAMTLSQLISKYKSLSNIPSGTPMRK